MRKSFSSLRARVLLLIAIPFVVMFGMTIYYMLDEREERLADARERVISTARLMAAEQRRNIDRAHQTMLSLALLPEVRHNFTSETCSRVLAKKVKEAGVLLTMQVARPNGDVVCSATKTPQLINIADRDYFQRTLQTHKFELGGFIISRSTGKPAIGTAYSLLDETGSPEAVVAAPLDIGWLETELANFSLPEGARAVVLGADGIILARHPDPEGWVGKAAPPGMPLVKSVLGSNTEGSTEEAGLDGVLRIFAFMPLHRATGGQVTFWVGIPKDAVVGPVERRFVWTILFALGLLGLTFGAFWLGNEHLFLRPVSALSDATHRLGQGDLNARAGLTSAVDELARLAQSFDRTADALQAKEQQLVGANRALRVLSAGNRTMLHAKQGELQLLDEMCRAIGEAGGYRMAWVGYAENDAEKSIRPVAHWARVAEGCFENVKLTWDETESGQPPPASAIRTGMPVVVQNIQTEAGPQPWRDYALHSGCGSCIALPLRIDDRVIGVLNICAEEADAFSDDEVRLLSEAAADLSFGIASQRASVEHAHMKRTLKTAEERFKAAAEASLDALFIAKCVRDEAGRLVHFECTDINAHAEKMLGMARERVIGQKLCELLPIDHRDDFFDKCTRVVATGASLEGEFPVDTPKLKARWLRHQVVRVDDGIAIFTRDVTLWKESGARLKESEERLRLATEAAHMGAWTWDPKSGRFSWSEGIGPVFGLSLGEGFDTLEELIQAVHPADRNIIVRAVSEAREKGIPYRGEFRTIWPDGTLHWVEGRSNFVRGANGFLKRGVGIAMDITERKRAESAWRESEQNYRSLADSASALIWTSGTNTLCNYFNQPWLNFTGRSLEQELGNGWAEGVHPDDSAQCLATYVGAFDRREPFSVEYRLRRHDGEFRWMRDDGCPRYDSSGEFIGYLGYVMDITERKQSEVALTHANRALRTLSACNDALIHAISEPELLNTVCRLVVEAGGYCMAWVGFAERDATKTVRVVAQYGADEGKLKSTNITWADTERGRGPTGTAIRTGATQVNQNILTNPAMAAWRDVALARGFQSNVAVPLKGPSGTYGALAIYSRECDAFNNDEVQLLEELADDLVFGITTLRTRAERDRMEYAHQHHEEILRKSLEESIQAIADTLEMRDPYTAGHQKRVAQLTVAIARDLGLPEDEIHGIQLAASIHDLGKIQVPAEILSKPGKLSKLEFMLIKTHAQAGYDILKGIEFPWPIANIVLQHHERLDGLGYPQGLKGDQILLGSRIIGVADVVEAITSHRPYRPALGIDIALKEIERGRGTAFDSAVVDACLKLFREERFGFQS